MKTLRSYLNGLDRAEQAVYAKQCGTTVGYLRKACSVGQPLREKLCALLELHSHRAVTRQDLRPEDWHVIWPELRSAADAEAASEQREPMHA